MRLGKRRSFFIPGWLRTLDLWCIRWAAACRLTRAGVAIFAVIDRRFPAVRRHGDLLGQPASSTTAVTRAPENADSLFDRAELLFRGNAACDPALCCMLG